MTVKKAIGVVIGLLAGLYLLLGLLVTLRIIWLCPPEQAADAYLQALKSSNTALVYMYSDLLGPRLIDMMNKSEMTEDDRKALWAKDYARWKSEYMRGSKALDSLRREREVISEHADFKRVTPESYKAEVRVDGDLNMVAYADVPGETHHLYYQLVYPAPGKAPRVSVLGNIRTGPKRRIKQMVLRVQVRRRPDVDALAALIMEASWISELEFLFPHLGLLSQADPTDVWMVGLSFDVDKLTLETY
jgi:hypothetical protein